MARFDPTKLDRIATWMQSYVDRKRFAGCATLIQQDGTEAYYHDTGLRDVENGVPWHRDTVARIYSMTKPVTSVALMMLAERGLFHLEAPVSEFIPSFANPTCLIEGATALDQVAPCAPPTLHQLLTHTSGLSYPFNPGILAEEMGARQIMFGPKAQSLTEMVDDLAALPLAFRPGSRWEYSVSIDVIGRVIEVVSGKSLAAFFDEEIIGPLGMVDTGFTVSEAAANRFAACYTPLDGDSFQLDNPALAQDSLRVTDPAAGSPYNTSTMHSGGGGLVSTIDDYMIFAEMLRTGGRGLISPATLAFMMRNHLSGDIASMGPTSFAEQPMEGMGFGIGGAVVLDPGRARSPGSVGDFSWGGMASTFFWVDSVHDLSVIFFTQLIPSSAYPGRPQLKQLVHGALT
ncbi:MAG: serine hydrolase domain-containing protein [Pseudomonadota bacterium]